MVSNKKRGKDAGLDPRSDKELDKEISHELDSYRELGAEKNRTNEEKNKTDEERNKIDDKNDELISKKEFEWWLGKINLIRAELSQVVVGQEKIIDGLIRALLANGHVLLEGVPGVAKTLVAKAMAIITGCKFGRIQFTVDMLPSDIVGITKLGQSGGYEVIKGPIFANFIIADEINRAPPKTQSALLEAMAEYQVSISKQTYQLDKPFFVMATQNPIETSGTYPLPEAQVDRFLFKLIIDYPEKHDEMMIIEQNVTLRPFESYHLQRVMTPSDIINIQKLVMKIQHSERINKYIVDIVNATRTPQKYGIHLGEYISLGASPRASIYLFIAAKADAFMSGNRHVTPQNVKNVAQDILRHRILVNYKAQVNNITTGKIIAEILDKVKIP